MGMVASVAIGADTAWVYSLTLAPITDATTFYNVRIGPEATAWAAAAALNQGRALAMSAEWIDRALGRFFTGAPSGVQPRAWPRDGAMCGGTPVPDGTTPDNLAYANFWLAGMALVDPAIVVMAGTGSNVKRVQAGPAQVEFFTPTVGGPTDTRLPLVAMDWLRCYLMAMLTGLSGSVSGVSGVSQFGPCDWRRSGGY